MERNTVNTHMQHENWHYNIVNIDTELLSICLEVTIFTYTDEVFTVILRSV